MRHVSRVLVLGLVVLAGCTSQRPLRKVLVDADFAARQGDYAAANRDYSYYISKRPEAVEVRHRYGKSLTAAGHPRLAIEQLNICTDVEPLNDEYLDAEADAMFKAGEREALQALLARTASERGRVRDYVRQGVYAVRLGNLDEAQQALLTAAKLDRGRSHQVQLALAEFYGSLGDRAKQVRRVRMAYYIQPNNPDVQATARALGEVTGPTFGLPPEEVTLTAAPE